VLNAIATLLARVCPEGHLHTKTHTKSHTSENTWQAEESDHGDIRTIIEACARWFAHYYERKER
jgi:hypothetical protein